MLFTLQLDMADDTTRMIIILDDQPIPIKVDLTDVPAQQFPERIHHVRTYKRLDATCRAGSTPRYTFVSEHYQVEPHA